MVSGREEMIGVTGEVLEDFDGKDGWRGCMARSGKSRAGNHYPRDKESGSLVCDGLTLEVTPEQAHHD